MIHMCHYISGTEYNESMRQRCASHKLAAEHAQTAGVGTLVLTHMTRQVDTDGVCKRVLKESFSEESVDLFPKFAAPSPWA